MKTTTQLQRKLFICFLFMLVIITTLKTQASTPSIVNFSSNTYAAAVETNRIWINATAANGAFSQTLFGYRAGATDGFDYGVDGAYWNTGAIALASLIGDVRYTIQFKGLPFSNTDVVPLSFTANQAGTYKFSIDHMDGFFLTPSFPVFIHDMVTNTYTNLKDGSYSFTCNAGMYNNRFQLTYIATTTNLGTSTSLFTTNSLAVSQINQSIIIKTGDVTLNSLQVYTLSGQQLYENKAINSNEITIPNDLFAKQLLVIRATSDTGVSVTKKWLAF